VPFKRSAAADTALTAPLGARDLEGKVRAGTKWSMLNSIVLSAGGTLIGAVLARTVFGPAAWGLYALSLAILAVLLSINELGVSAAIIRWQGDIRAFAGTAVTLCLIASTLTYVALYAISPFVARLFNTPDATPMLRVLCVCVIIDALCAVPNALLNREFAQGRRMLVDCLTFSVSASVTLLLAFTGHGVMSLAWGGIAGSIAGLITCNAVAPYIVLPGWDGLQGRRLLRFGLPLAGANLFGLAVLNVDSLIVAGTLGPAMLGLYQLAFSISSAPVSVIRLVVQRVSYAGFSRVAEGGRGLAQAFNRSLSLLMALAVPACVLLATLGRPLIHAVYGERWVSASGTLSVLALFGLMRLSFLLMNNCIVAADKRSMVMIIQILWLAAVIPALLVGARLDGIIGAAAGHALVGAAIVVPASLWTVSRLGISARSIARACARPAAGGVLMAVASLLVIRLAGAGVGGLIAAAVAGAGTYLPVVYPMRSLLRRSPESREQMAAGDSAISGTTTATIFDLERLGSLCVLSYTT